MPVYRRYFDPGQLQFITSSTYRRVKLFDSERFRRDFVDVLRQLREQWGFLLIGWFVMPEHFHLLLWPSPQANPSQIVQRLKARTAKFTLSNLAAHREHPWCARKPGGNLETWWKPGDRHLVHRVFLSAC
jgi:putative transposase